MTAFTSAVIALAFAAAAEAQTTIRVPQDQPTIQAGINAAFNGDTVLVAPGIYVENINFVGKAITVTTEAGAGVTIIDGNRAGPVVRFASGEGRASVLSGFTVRNGHNQLGLPPGGIGGGISIRNSSPTITGNIVANNSACNGGGIGIEIITADALPSPVIQGNTIVNNRREGCTGGGGGGGVYASIGGPTPAAEILDNVISGNVLNDGDGGGIWSVQKATIRGNVITDNAVPKANPSDCSVGGGSGGGIYATSFTTIVQNVIIGNTACTGGGLFLDSGSNGRLVVNNTIAENDSAVGSGIVFRGLTNSVPEPTNNVIVAKAGQTAVLCPSTVVPNIGIPVFRSNNVYAPGGTTYSGICSDVTGTNGNISADPQFVDLAARNLRLQPSSPSLDAGDSTVTGDVNLFPVPARDVDGKARLADGDGNGSALIDQGAYERARRAKRTDFAGDGRSDVLWRNIVSGENYVYPMNGTAIEPAEGFVRTVPPLTWQIVGTGDFDGDGKTDILWRHGTTGQNYIYFMDGTAIKPTEGFIRTVADQNWQVAGVGDFDGDGKDDILWRHRVTGENYLYLMDGLTIKPSEGFIRTVADVSWRIAGVGDFDGDGKSDILWRSDLGGQNYIYPMDGTAIKPTEGFLRTVPDSGWEVKGVGDFDGDGKSDILWRHNQSGENYLYPMDDTAIKPSEGFLRTVGDLSWQIVATGDYDGDGKSDILWRNSVTGQNYIYPMDGTAIKPGEGFIRTVPLQLGWQVVGR